MSQYRALFTVWKHERPGSESEAVTLIRMIDTHFNEPHSSGSSQDAARQIPAQSASKHLLDRYIDVEVIRQKIEVTRKTMKKYLDESGVELIEFSQKRQLIHEKEVEKLLDYYKKKK
jgi:hypothetical protein